VSNAPLPKPTVSSVSTLPTETLDCSAGWDRKEQFEIIKNRLRKLGRYKPKLLYRGIDGSRDLKKLGIEVAGRTEFSCSTEEDFLENEGAYGEIIEWKQPAIVVTVWSPEQHPVPSQADGLVHASELFHLLQVPNIGRGQIALSIFAAGLRAFLLGFRCREDYLHM